MGGFELRQADSERLAFVSDKPGRLIRERKRLRTYLSEATMTVEVEKRPGEREDVTGWSLFIAELCGTHSNSRHMETETRPQGRPGPYRFIPYHATVCVSES